MKIKRLQDWKIISVGGSIIIPKTGFDIAFLKKFRALILTQVKKGQKFILVIGGGATARTYQAAGRRLGFKNESLDWTGIHATMINADFVRVMFGSFAPSQLVYNPNFKMETNKPIIVASGWKPGCSTDKDAVLLAKTYGAKEVINLSNVDYVYDSDPKKNRKAKKFKALTWKQFRKIVGSKWVPGANVPFDPSAAKEAQKLGLTVKFAKGTDLRAVAAAITGKSVIGTVIR